jgi:diguanylate cyclase (GGDEF)-like protein
VIVEKEDQDQHRLVAAALRLALAEKLQLDPTELEGLDAEAAAAALQPFVRRSLGPDRLLDWMEGESDDERARELIAYGIRQALAYELGVHPEQLQRMHLAGAAHALDRIRSRRVAARSAATTDVRTAILEDDRRLVGRILAEALGEQLDVPAYVLEALNPDLAAHILGTVLTLRRRAEAQGLPAPEAQAPDRRDLVARVVRDAVAQDAELHPSMLRSLDPAAGAVLLGRFAEARRTMDTLRSHIATDELTEALRRSAGEVELEREIARLERFGDSRLVVAFLDVDALKAVNDNLGHEAGDKLLQALVHTLRARLRGYDSIVRWGGDEFVVVLPQTDLEAARGIMGAVWRQFKEASGQSFSYGLAPLISGDTVSQLVARADSALYERRRAVAEGGGEETVDDPAGGSPPLTPQPPRPPAATRWQRFARFLAGKPAAP